VQRYGGLDYLFNNAGIEGPPGALDVTTEAGIDEVMAINVKGVLLCMKHAVPRMLARGGGAIVNNASFIGTTLPFPGAVMYGATKAAVLSMTRAVAAGYSAQHVRVHAVCPWITDTPMIDRLAGHQAEAKARLASLNPSGRIVAPDEIAGVVLSIFSGDAGLDPGDAVLVDTAGVTRRVLPCTVGGMAMLEPARR
jgi:NAD(P)-dependent dehydrogenase (short-subunit alcohol dehydrogenase family)